MKPGPKPRTLSRELLDQIEQHASRGLSQQQICHSLGISESWWYDVKQKNSEISAPCCLASYQQVSKIPKAWQICCCERPRD